MSRVNSQGREVGVTAAGVWNADRPLRPMEWTCPQCDTKQVGRPEHGCERGCPAPQGQRPGKAKPFTGLDGERPPMPRPQETRAMSARDPRAIAAQFVPAVAKSGGPFTLDDIAQVVRGVVNDAIAQLQAPGGTFATLPDQPRLDIAAALYLLADTQEQAETPATGVSDAQTLRELAALVTEGMTFEDAQPPEGEALLQPSMDVEPVVTALGDDDII